MILLYKQLIKNFLLYTQKHYYEYFLIHVLKFIRNILKNYIESRQGFYFFVLIIPCNSFMFLSQLLFSEIKFCKVYTLKYKVIKAILVFIGL